MFYSPLRYPGGKAKIAKYLIDIMKNNNISGGHYVEPYAGGSGAALEILFSGQASHIHINDIDQGIYSFWKSVVDQPDELCKLISDTPVLMDIWHKQKDILSNTDEHSELKIGFATFFLNRTNRSGILKGGVIGGKEQSGEWKLDARYNKTNLISRIEKIAKFSAYISVYREDAIVNISRLNKILPSNTLIYLDPPYYNKGKGLYRNFYEHDDHVEIEATLAQLNSMKWLVSYDNVPQIREIYKAYECIEYTLRYIAQVKKKGSEVLFFGNNLEVPKPLLSLP